MSSSKLKIAIIGLGYVGLPLAVALAQHHEIVAFDKNAKRIDELSKAIDRTKEINPQELSNSKIFFTCDEKDLAKASLFIVAVPTPIDNHKQPDFTLLKLASEIVGRNMPKGSIVVFESTVYPGATEDICIPILEKASGMKNPNDFTVGYSPERINPGDKEHTIEKVVKVVSAQNAQTLDVIDNVYSSIVKAGTYRAPNIRTAEAAKVIENTQRDINIALMNELAMIFDKMNIDTHEVLSAARTKWNFLPFYPGLVGGHCIGVDPYYLTFQAEYYGHHPVMILRGRRINDEMGKYIAQQTIKHLIKSGQPIKNAKIGILGFTFKENCPDVRNTKIIDIIDELHSYDIETVVYDPVADSDQTSENYKVSLAQYSSLTNLSALIITVAHDEFKRITLDEYKSMLTKPYVLVDVKGMLDKAECKIQNINLWRL